MDKEDLKDPEAFRDPDCLVQVLVDQDSLVQDQVGLDSLVDLDFLVQDQVGPDSRE